MRKNNYDQSSSGLNLELTCFRDTERSYMEFEESFKRVKDGLWVYTNFGNVSDEFNLSDANNYQFTVKEFKKAFIKSYDSSLSAYYIGKPFGKLTKAELIELLECQAYDSDEIADFYKDNFKPLFDIVKTRGYCQGDYAEVIITPSYKKYLSGNGQDYDTIADKVSDNIDRLFWDAPIYCRLSVDDEIEFYLDQYLTDCYKWDKDQLITQFKIVQTDLFYKTDASNFESLEQLDSVLGFLADNLPDYPDYQ